MEERERERERDLLIPNTEHSPHAKLSHSHSPILILFASFTVSLSPPSAPCLPLAVSSFAC